MGIVRRFGRFGGSRSEARGVGYFDRGADDHPGGKVSRVGSDRLQALGSDGLFSSALSATEFALLSDLGPQPLALVMGTSVFQVGWQYLRPDAQWGASNFYSRLDVVDQAWADARRLAFGRLLTEARSVGADAVVGVRLRRGEHDWARRSVDFMVTGTAIRLPDGAGGSGDPVLSDLSVQEYWKLAAGGWAPSGLLAATAVFFVSQGFSTRVRRRASFFRNQELIEFSDGFGAARRAVVEDLRGQAQLSGADGVVGVTLDYKLEARKISVMRMPVQPTGLSASTIALGGDAPMRGGGGSDSRDGIVFTVHAVGTGVRRATPREPVSTPVILSVGAAL